MYHEFHEFQRLLLFPETRCSQCEKLLPEMLSVAAQKKLSTLLRSATVESVSFKTLVSKVNSSSYSKKDYETWILWMSILITC